MAMCMENLKLFDCHCSFGRTGIVNPGSFHSQKDVMWRMEYYGIKRALVFHSIAREYNPAIGNRLLLEELNNSV